MALSRTQPKKEFGHQPIKSGVPLSFGSNFHDDPITRSSLRKAQSLQLNAQCDHDPHTAYDFAAQAGHSSFTKSSATIGSGTQGPLRQPRLLSGSYTDMGTVKDGSLNSQKPQENEDKILRFLGYIKERIPESPDETVRVRKVAIVYHVGDQSILIREAQQVNSGMTQSVLLKRQRVLRSSTEADDDYVDHSDLQIGNTVDLIGRRVTIVDTDESSRRFLTEQLGYNVPEALPWPGEDAYNDKQKTKLSVKPKKSIPTADMEHRRAMESAAGGAVSKHAPDDIRIAQQFFSNKINQSLQFAAYWDDRKAISGDLRLVVIRYYLENDSIEVVEKRDENCGREGGNRLLNRQRVTKPGQEKADPGQQQNTFGMLTKRGYYTMDDFSLGSPILLYGRNYQVYDADAFTRQWFQENRGRDLGPAQDVEGVKMKGFKPPPVQYPPPHNGFGSEEDSLHAWKNLLRKPPKVDGAKLAREEGKVMLFSAHLDGSTQPEDAGREFLVYFYRQTDEVEVIERQIRNTGIIGGKFLAKGKHRKLLPDGRKVMYTPEDFVAGETVEIAGRRFFLEAMDERSRKMISGEVDAVSEDRVRELVVLLKNLLQWKYVRMHEAYRAIAPQGSLTVDELTKFYKASAANVSIEEASHVVNFLAPEGNGVIPYPEFVKAMDVPNSTNLDEMSNNPRAVKGVDVSGGAEQQQQILNATMGAQRRTRANALKKIFVAKVVERRGTVQEVFRLLAGHSPNSRLSRSEFTNALVHVFHMDLPKTDMEALTESLFNTAKGEEVTFKEFHLYVESAM